MDECNFQIKQSTITKAGKGLFTKTNIENETIVLEYKGKIQPYHSHKDHEYCFEIRKNVCVNAKKNKGLARYINDTYEHSHKLVNLDWVHINGKVYMKSIQYIPKETELFIKYGNDYWK